MQLVKSTHLVSCTRHTSRSDIATSRSTLLEPLLFLLRFASCRKGTNASHSCLVATDELFSDLETTDECNTLSCFIFVILALHAMAQKWAHIMKRYKQNFHVSWHRSLNSVPAFSFRRYSRHEC